MYGLHAVIMGNTSRLVMSTFFSKELSKDYMLVTIYNSSPKL